ncbi:MAG: ATP-binding protein [Enterovibrio sp.]
MAKRMNSIRRFLLIGTLSLVTLGLGFGAIFGSMQARHEMAELFDVRLAQSAHIINTLLRDYLSYNKMQLDPDLPASDFYAKASADLELVYEQTKITLLSDDIGKTVHFQLFDHKGALLLRSPNSPVAPLTPRVAGFNDISLNGASYRTITLFNQQQQTWLVVAELDGDREELANALAIVGAVPLLSTLPVLLLLLWWLIVRGLRPLRQLSNAISQRDPTNLRPLDLDFDIQELAPLVKEINRLMEALAITIEREQQFTNEVAHELRTPLAVLRIYSENALAADSESERKASLQKMLGALDRSDRLIRQLLTLARIDNQQKMVQSRLDLTVILQAVLGQLTPLALKKEQELALEVSEPLFVLGQSTLLELLFSNLVDNALRYTPRGGKIEVTAQKLLKNDGETVLKIMISDSGPGIPAELLHKVSERFFRVNPQLPDGVGLGMAIVARIATLHRATFTLENQPQGGLRVTVFLPQAS